MVLSAIGSIHTSQALSVGSSLPGDNALMKWLKDQLTDTVEAQVKKDLKRWFWQQLQTIPGPDPVAICRSITEKVDGGCNRFVDAAEPSFRYPVGIYLTVGVLAAVPIVLLIVKNQRFKKLSLCHRPSRRDSDPVDPPSPRDDCVVIAHTMPDVARDQRQFARERLTDAAIIINSLGLVVFGVFTGVLFLALRDVMRDDLCHSMQRVVHDTCTNELGPGIDRVTAEFDKWYSGIAT